MRLDRIGFAKTVGVLVLILGLNFVVMQVLLGTLPLENAPRLTETSYLGLLALVMVAELLVGYRQGRRMPPGRGPSGARLGLRLLLAMVLLAMAAIAMRVLLDGVDIGTAVTDWRTVTGSAGLLAVIPLLVGIVIGRAVRTGHDRAGA